MKALCRMLCAAPLLAALAVQAQDIDSTPSNPGPQALTGTLARVRASGSIALAYRDSSVPFSYLDVRGQPIGYSIELCKALVRSVEVAVQRSVQIRWVPVTSATRMEAITSGQADLECGSTTSNLERQKTVAFSPTIFVAGTRLLVRKGEGLRDWRDLSRKKVAVIWRSRGAACDFRREAGDLYRGLCPVWVRSNYLAARRGADPAGRGRRAPDTPDPRPRHEHLPP